MARQTITKFTSDVTGEEVPDDASDVGTLRFRLEDGNKAFELDARLGDKLDGIATLEDLIKKGREVGIPGKRK